MEMIEGVLTLTGLCLAVAAGLFFVFLIWTCLVTISRRG